MRVTRADVVECYRRILHREPDSEAMVEKQVASGRDLITLACDFANSEEHRTWAARSSSHSLTKCLSPRYLARGLSAETRTACLMFNYANVQGRLSRSSLVTLLQDGLRLYEEPGRDDGFVVDVRLFAGSVHEGEISLVLSAQGVQLAILTFTIVPPAEFGLDGDVGFLVSRIQSYLGTSEVLRAITKRTAEIASPYILVALLEGIAQAHGASWLIGVNAQAQPSFDEQHAAVFERSYDEMFVSLGAERLSSGLFAVPLPRREKPLVLVAASHRARTRKKRAVRRALTDAANHRWRGYLNHTPPHANRPRSLRHSRLRARFLRQWAKHAVPVRLK